MRTGRGVFAALAAALAWALFAAVCGAAEQHGAATTGDASREQPAAYVLALTDFHGALEARGKDVGLARLAGAVRAFRAAHPHTLVVAVGDLFTGSVESDMLRGKPVMEGLRHMGVALSAVGNHEFDWDRADIEKWSRNGLPFVAANIRNSEGRVPEGVEPFRILEAGGLRIAFVGLVTPATARMTNPESVKGLEFGQPGPALRAAVAEARAAGAQAVVVLAHLSSPAKNADWPDGIAPAIVELAKTPGVSAVIYGHSHEEHISRIGQVSVVQPAYRGRSLAVLALRRDAAAPGGVAVTAELDRLSARADTLKEDPAAARLVLDARKELGPLLDTVEGRVARTLEPDDAGPSLLGEVVCDALRARTGADAALVNGGGLRGALDKGDITRRDLYRVLPFDNSVKVLRLNGAELRRALEHGLVAPGDADGPGRFVQMSGLRVVYDLARPRGQRIVSMALPDGRPVTARTELRVAVSSFLAKGGDGYPLGKAGRGRESFALRERDALGAYLKAKDALDPRFEGWLRPAP